MPESLAQVFSCEFYEISKNTFFYRTPLVAASVVKISDNVTAAEVSAINTELKKLCKEKKKYQIGLPSKVKDEVGKYAHIYGTQAAIAQFRGKYQHCYRKRTNRSCDFSENGNFNW